MAKIDLSKYGIQERQKSYTILLMNYYLRKRQNQNSKVLKKDRKVNLVQSM